MADKRGRPDEKLDKPSKKMKETTGKVGAVQTHVGPGRPKAKSVNVSYSHDRSIHIKDNRITLYCIAGLVKKCSNSFISCREYTTNAVKAEMLDREWHI